MVACRSCADARHENAVKYNQSKDLTAAPELINKDLMSVMSELAVAKCFNIAYTYPCLYQKGRSDLSNGVEVRATLHKQGNLIIQSYDKPAPYVLTTIDLVNNTVLIVGWRDLVDCRLDKYWRTKPAVRKDSYWVPQSDLLPISDLKQKLQYV